MRFRTALFLFGCLFVWAQCLRAAPPDAREKATRQEYDDVWVKGNKAFSEKELLATAGIPRPSKLHPFKKRATLKRADLDTGVQEMLLFYQRNGYFEASVELADGPAKSAEIRVSEGAPCHVAGVALELKPEDADPGTVSLEALRAALPLRSSDVFTVQAYEDAQKKVVQAFKEHGFPFADADAEAVADLQARTISVRLWAEPKSKAVFGAILVQGIVHTEEAIIRRALLFREGQPYDQSLVDKSQDVLYAMGLFETVTIFPKRKSEPGTAVMVVKVKEGRHKRVRVGLGYGSYEGVRGQLDWETLRVDGRILTLGTSLKASRLETNATAYLKRPFFLTRANTFLADVTYGRTEYPYFAWYALRGRVGIEHEFNKWLKGAVSLKANRVTDVVAEPSLAKAVPPGARDPATLPSVEASLTLRTTDDVFAPTKGFLVNLSAEPVLDSTNRVEFTKAIADGRSYVALSSDWVLAFKLKLGAILTGADPSEIHITQRFYAGGSGSVRGYGYNVLGPLSPKGVLLGGDAIVEASSELRFPLAGDLKGVFFVDAGNAFNKSFKVSGKDLYTGAGFGVRYKTPVGPIGLDVAWKLKTYPLDPSPYLFYFFIGYAF